MAGVPNSILDDTKKALGLAPDYDPFDAELIMHINSVLANLNQLGVGPVSGYEIDSSADLWNDFLGDWARLNNVKSYVYLAVKMMFDPPNVGYVLTAMEKQLEKAEWRINVAREELIYPPEPEGWIPEMNDTIILDGGTG